MNINTVIYGEAALKFTVLYKLKHYMNVSDLSSNQRILHVHTTVVAGITSLY